MARAEPDGYTLLVGIIGIHAASTIYENLNYVGMVQFTRRPPGTVAGTATEAVADMLSTKTKPASSSSSVWAPA